MGKSKMQLETTSDGQIRVLGADDQRELKGNAGVWDLYQENLGNDFSHIIALPQGNPTPVNCYGFVVPTGSSEQEIERKVTQFAKS